MLLLCWECIGRAFHAFVQIWMLSSGFLFYLLVEKYDFVLWFLEEKMTNFFEMENVLSMYLIRHHIIKMYVA